jgi:Mce-associated membrane protein
MTDDQPDTPETEPVAPPLARPKVHIGLATLAVALAATATVFGIQTAPAGSPTPGDNSAFLDPAATRDMLDEIAKTVATVFTIDPKTVPATQQAANDNLVGRATDQYKALYGQLLQQAPQQGMSLTTTVRATGVTVLNGDRAQLLVLADQNANVTATGQTQSGQAHLDLIAERHDGHWKIASIEIL